MKHEIVPKHYNNFFSYVFSTFHNIMNLLISPLVVLSGFGLALACILAALIIGPVYNNYVLIILFVPSLLLLLNVFWYFTCWEIVIQVNWKNYVSCISDAYCWSIRESLTTERPEGIIYILQNILKELKKFNLNNRQPYKTNNGTIWGFPNQTNLKEAIYMAQDLSQHWISLDATQRSRSMGEIRAKIQSEELFLSWRYMHKNDIPHNKKIYWYSYTDEDHRNLSLQESRLANPTVIPTKPAISRGAQHQSPQQHEEILGYEEWLDENYQALQFVPKESRRQAYANYRKSLEAQTDYDEEYCYGSLNFEEWLASKPHPGIEFLDPAEQQQLYQKYLWLAE
ncbi:MAG: hypothetical protein F6K14_12060 [Symploca sp. SIO2C1]|nr:hypothetical protein [Symploca sp. SIO2C1]